MDHETYDVEVAYNASTRKKWLYIMIIFILMAIAAIGTLFIAQLHMTVSDVIDVLIAHITGNTAGNPIFDLVVWEYNVPRALLGVIVGSSLGVGGAIMQSIMRNPLATPYTTGVSAGASMGAALFVYLDIAILWTGGYMSSVAINAIVFAMIPTLAILFVSQKKYVTPTTMILAGIAMMYIFSSVTSLLMLLADPTKVQEAYIWNVGSLGRANWDNVGFVIASVLPCMMILYLLAQQVNLMNSGNVSAKSMGVNVKLVRNICLITIAIMTAITVGVTGGIGFMGLVAPHVSRMIVGSHIKYLVPCSAALGALILLVADAVSRIIIPEGMPVGVITAVIGGPIFMLLLVRGSKKVWF